MRQLDYKGYIEYTFPTEQDMAIFYENVTDNILGLKTNQYALLYSPDGNLVDRVKWNGEKYVAVTYRTINNDWFQKIKPRNVEQELAFDLLQDKNTLVKLITGKMGSGKTFLCACHAINGLKSNKFDRIVWIRNNVIVRNVPDIGALPGTALEKLIDYCMPLADALGGKEGLMSLISFGKVEIIPLGTIRGRDIKNSCIIVSEAENLTKDHLQLILGRVGEGSVLYLDGDIRQVDKPVFENDNGIVAAVEKLAGNELFGYVDLQQVERSKVAMLTDLFYD